MLQGIFLTQRLKPFRKSTPYIRKFLFAPPEFRNIKALSLKIRLFEVIINDKKICFYGGVDAFKKNGEKEIYQDHLINPFRNRCS
jgi:hypothetical protein